MRWFHSLSLDEQQRLIGFENVREKEEADQLELIASAGLTKKAL